MGLRWEQRVRGRLCSAHSLGFEHPSSGGEKKGAARHIVGKEPVPLIARGCKAYPWVSILRCTCIQMVALHRRRHRICSHCCTASGICVMHLAPEFRD